MAKRLSAEAVAQYRRDGFHFPVRVLSADEARSLSRPAGSGRNARWADRWPATGATRFTCSSPGPTSWRAIPPSSTPSRT